MGIITWIILGALAGWIASLIMRTDAEQGALGNIIVGIVGAFLGGFMAQALGAEGVTGFNFYSIVVAILGAVLLLWIVSLFRGGSAEVRR
ncbi:MAG TPA: GlsB/YeaQ/YmgE family stress response membrane protein [Candidatus Dormibacteraeota bacterium]|nr:GlsB/YeaQ/YmgE family stress response membrane protein [Candidatus Dormibacteraeota bacterium]